MKKIIWGLFFIFMILPSYSFAVPITDGYIHADLPDAWANGPFSFSGSDFHVSGHYSGGLVGTRGGPYPHHWELNIDMGASGNAFYGGGIYVSGAERLTMNWGDLNASGPSIFRITGPPIPLGTEAGIYTGSFSFTDSLCGTTGGAGGTHPCDAWRPSLEGVGIVRAVVGDVLVPDGHSPHLYFREVTYTFTNPVPEPTTLILLGTGLVGIAGWGRKRFNKKN